MVVEKFYSLVKPEVIENYRTVSRITSLLQFQKWGIHLNTPVDLKGILPAKTT
jgi:hypothetical protein